MKTWPLDELSHWGWWNKYLAQRVNSHLNMILFLSCQSEKMWVSMNTTQVLLEFTYITCIRISNVHSWLLGHICKLWESSGSSFFKISLILMFQLWNSFVHIFLCCKSMSELFAFLFSILKIKCQNVRYSFSEVNLCLVNLTKVFNESFKVLFFWRHLLCLWKIIQKERGNRQNWTGISLSFLLLLCIISFIAFLKSTSRKAPTISFDSDNCIRPG